MYRAHQEETDVKNNNPLSRPDSALFRGRRSRPGTADQANVLRCWRSIQDQCDDRAITQKKDTRNTVVGWKTVRLFVSSTFTDFHKEREVLVKKVFPALREWCEQWRLALMECDLRWGIPKDSDSAATIATCLEEIDRCYEDDDGQPFFLNLLGERYGWVPDIENVPDDIREKYQWIPGISITHMEILHGAYRMQNPNAAFFLRDPSFLDDLSEDQADRYIDYNPEAVQHLRVLKQKLRERFPSQVFGFSPKIENTHGKKKAQNHNLDSFGNTVFDFFKKAIESRYCCSGDIRSLTEAQQEYESHYKLMQIKAEFVKGRDYELQVLEDFTRGKIHSDIGRFESSDKDDAAVEKFGLLKSDQPILCVTAPSGHGKSALLAKLATILRKKGERVVYHSVGCTVNSMQPSGVLTTLARGLKAELDAECDESKLKENISKHRERKEKVIFIIDGINEVIGGSGANFSWMPTRLPPNAPCIISVDSSNSAAIYSVKNTLQAYQFEIGDIEPHARHSIIQFYFSNFSKKLDAEQMNLLVHHTGASVPLWLGLACEELRLHGDFRSVSSKIQHFPPTVGGLFNSILQRLLAEDQAGLIKKLLCMICISLGGVPESEVRRMLTEDGAVKGAADVPMIVWAGVRRQMKPFLRNVIYWYNGALRMQFFHATMSQAVKELLLQESEERRKWHEYLADYYDKRCEDLAYTVEDLPYHLEQAGCKQRGEDDGLTLKQRRLNVSCLLELKDFYHKDRRSMTSPQHARQNYLNRLRCQQMATDQQGLGYPISLCRMCAGKTHVVSPAQGFRLADTCLICGKWNAGPGFSTKALLCPRHHRVRPPRSQWCHLCNHAIAGPLGPVSNAQLCMRCSSRPMCCQILT